MFDICLRNLCGVNCERRFRIHVTGHATCLQIRLEIGCLCRQGAPRGEQLLLDHEGSAGDPHWTLPCSPCSQRQVPLHGDALYSSATVSAYPHWRMTDSVKSVCTDKAFSLHMCNVCTPRAYTELLALLHKSQWPLTGRVLASAGM